MECKICGCKLNAHNRVEDENVCVYCKIEKLKNLNKALHTALGRKTIQLYETRELLRNAYAEITTLKKSKN